MSIPIPKVAFTPRSEDFAFALRMLGLESSPHAAQATQSKAPLTTDEAPLSASSMPVSDSSSHLTQSGIPVAQAPGSAEQQSDSSRNQPASDARTETQPSSPETQRSDNGLQPQSNATASVQASPQKQEVTPHWNGAGVYQSPEIDSGATAAQPPDATETSSTLAAHETHSLAPEMPSNSASSEILLHLAGNDQSLAAIRVADRAGVVNVSVHASDAALRQSLQSNLSDLSMQLNSQGWKADVIQPAAIAAHSEGQQDGNAGGQRSFSQHPSSGGERQAPRDRRGNGGQWQQDFDQQISGGDAPSGGN